MAIILTAQMVYVVQQLPGAPVNFQNFASTFNVLSGDIP